MPETRYIMSGDARNKHILDTSAWNALLDDPSQNFVVQKLQTVFVIPTTLAICEIAAEPDPRRRQALLKLVRLVGGDRRPLAMPNQLMILACQGYARRDRTLNICGGGEAEGAWNRPE